MLLRFKREKRTDQIRDSLMTASDTEDLRGPKTAKYSIIKTNVQQLNCSY